MIRTSILVLATIFEATAARAESAAPTRKAAVLEFRAGTEGARDLALSAAAVLREATSLSIIDVNDARRIGGAHIDREIAACAGKTACIAAAGARLGVDEVILVGVAEFGDLIVTLQRISVESRQVVARVADSLAKGTEPDLEMVERYLRRVLPPEDFLRYGKISIQANVPGALVWIGNTLEGTTPLPPITVPAPSMQEVRVAKPGYVDFHARVQVNPDGTVELRPTLVKRESGVWYKKWWVWAIAGGIATGAAVTGMLLAEPAPSAVPVVLEWR